jgi:rare lipoprotein A (peptidoglycan hydrolase)
MLAEVFLATWYAAGLHSPDALTAASRDHARGTVLCVHHKDKHVLVKVNDYGPEAHTGVRLDLSRGAFKKLSRLSTGKIEVWLCDKNH